MKIIYLVLISLLASINITSCGGGGSSSTPAELNGQFIDSIVIGLRYETATTSGFTDAQGRFNYREGETVRFYVGDVFLGEASGQAIVTPIELVLSATDETHIQVQNIAIFLQSIDDDGIESNGINITRLTNDAAVEQTVDFTLSSGVFDTDGALQTLISNLTSVNGTARSLLSREQVVSALNTNLLALLVGDYQGTFSGDDTGSWTISIDSTGDITGQSVSDVYGTDTISGSVASNGESNISGMAGSSVFSGSFTRGGSVSGTWSDDDEDGGTFSGSRVFDATPEPDPGTGTNSGSLTISGGDSSVIGVLFSPNLDTAVVNDPSGQFSNIVFVTWFQNITSSAEIEIRSLQLVYDKNTGVATIGYFRATSQDINSDPTSFYTYSLSCEDDPQVCDSVTLNAVGKSIEFNGFNLPALGDDDATGTILLNGTLNW